MEKYIKPELEVINMLIEGSLLCASARLGVSSDDLEDGQDYD